MINIYADSTADHFGRWVVWAEDTTIPDEYEEHWILTWSYNSAEEALGCAIVFLIKHRYNTDNIKIVEGFGNKQVGKDWRYL